MAELVKINVYRDNDGSFRYVGIDEDGENVKEVKSRGSYKNRQLALRAAREKHPKVRIHQI